VKGSEQPNEGEGNGTAARRYNEAQRRFVRSGQVEEKAREAKKALEGSEQREMERAEAVGKRHMRPKIRKLPESIRQSSWGHPSGRN
jgi:hypothetical protein